MGQMMEMCRKQEGGAKSDVQDMMAGKPPSTSAAKCMQACIGEAAEIV